MGEGVGRGEEVEEKKKEGCQYYKRRRGREGGREKNEN
jgi:hypothetical protein